MFRNFFLRVTVYFFLFPTFLLHTESLFPWMTVRSSLLLWFSSLPFSSRVSLPTTQLLSLSLSPSSADSFVDTHHITDPLSITLLTWRYIVSLMGPVHLHWQMNPQHFTSAQTTFAADLICLPQHFPYLGPAIHPTVSLLRWFFGISILIA